MSEDGCSFSGSSTPPPLPSDPPLAELRALLAAERARRRHLLVQRVWIRVAKAALDASRRAASHAAREVRVAPPPLRPPANVLTSS